MRLSSVEEITRVADRPDSAWARYLVIVRLRDGTDLVAIPVKLGHARAARIAMLWNDVVHPIADAG